MKAAPCSCRVRMNRDLVQTPASDMTKSAFSSPGTPKMYSMPFFFQTFDK